MSPSNLSGLSQVLSISPQFNHYETITDRNVLSKLEKWKQDAASAFRNILTLLNAGGDALSLQEQGNVIFATVPFSTQLVSEWNGEPQLSRESETWINYDSQLVANHILSLPCLSPSIDLAAHILTYKLKPIFKGSPHPHLHGETGRKIPKPAGGSMAMQDYYEEQRWKEYPGVYKLVLWCAGAIQQDAYERLWHLIIPPVMTLLDDYEAKYKLQGVLTVEMILQHVPADLLKRTGVDGLLRQSLRSCLSHLQSPETPQLLKRAIKASVSLTLLTTSVSPGIQPSPNRFNELSSLLGEGIITGIWIYAEDKPDVVNATFEALPELLKALGIGSVRFLKTLIPQLTHTLVPRALVEPDRELQNSAISALLTLFDTCSPRIDSWKETILDAVGRCWVALIDEDNIAMHPEGIQNMEERTHVKIGLQKICLKMAEICPSVVKEGFPRFILADKGLFEGLIPHTLIASA